MKKAYCLYRVSTKKQVDKQKNDIPMQRIACREFAKQKDWIIEKEFMERGVSGFKVSADDRDAIHDLKEAAQKGEFDILLVYMFDRLGRRDDETPFVVEWFVKQGIEVWSTQEGQQRFENQTDKLLNYIRYWQANGESVKTSMRIKTRMTQLTADGIYHGGVTPFGYRTVNNGRKNKHGQDVKDIEINPEEADYVRLIFDKTVNEGYGSYRMATLLNEMKVKTHNGSKFQCNTVNRILHNRMYCGYLVSGEAVSPKIENLAIVDENVFDSAQNILVQRSKKNDEKQHIARTTKGKTLLSGNIYCGHCGGALVATSYTDSYTRTDGTTVKTSGIRYICYHRSRKLNDCDGQLVYVAERIDNEVVKIVQSYLSKIKVTPKDKALEIHYQRIIDEKRRLQKSLKAERDKIQNRLDELSSEVGRCLSGESRFSVDVLSMAIDKTKSELKGVDKRLEDCGTELSRQRDVLEKLDYHYSHFRTWAEEFAKASREQKKMIICQLIDSVTVSRGYEIEIEFNISYKQFLAE